MKVCKIIDEYRGSKTIGYLFYYEKSNVYSIELDDRMRSGDMPLFFHGFITRHIYTLPPEWSRRWVHTRVVPEDRQNISMILRDNSLKEYDMYRLLMISEGRCSQDDCAVLPVRYEDLPAWVLERRRKKIDLAVRLNEKDIMMVYRDGNVYRTDLSRDLDSGQYDPSFDIISRRDYEVMAGGVGLEFSGGRVLTAEELYGRGAKLAISSEELRIIAKEYIMDTREVCDELDCSRQYTNYITRASGVTLLKDGGVHIYARSDIKRLME